MGATNASPGWDESLHLSDGSHRHTAPTTEPDAWRQRRKVHIELHIKEAKEANKPLRSNGDAELADLADEAAEATEGGVYFAYSEQPSPGGMKYYVFQQLSTRAGKRMTRSEAISELHLAIHQPRPRGL